MRIQLVLVLTLVTITLSAVRLGAAEMRGLWVDSWSAGFRSPEQTTAMVNKAKECNFNAIFVQVRRRGDVFYTSVIEPMAQEVPAGYDPLADIVTKAHAAGLQVHAWIATYEVYHDIPGKKADKRLVHAKHPEWLLKNSKGNTKLSGDKVYLDPGVPEVRSYLVRIVEEITRHYDVDGIHLDLVRYPETDAGYNETSVKLFNAEKNRSGQPEHDDSEWRRWRSEQVTEFVRMAYESATRIKPRMQVSASVFANKQDAAWQRMQDWDEWMKMGILDFAVPMLFVTDERLFAAMSAELAASRHGRAIYIGQGAYKNRMDDTLKQLELARKSGVGGIVVYNYWCAMRVRPGDDTSLMDKLKGGLFAKPDSPPVLDWKK